MSRSFIPDRESDLVTWSNNFATKIAATPTAFGLVALQATAFTALNTAWIAAYNVARDAATRSPSNIILKDNAKRLMVADARVLAGVIQKFPAITDAQRSDLGLTVPKPGPTPTPIPTEAPVLSVVSITSHTVRVALREPLSTKRSKPQYTFGANVLSFVGAVPPTTGAGWHLEGTTTKTEFDIEFPGTLAAGTQVWLTAYWLNPRAVGGPACTPITTNIAYGGLPMAEAA